MKQRILPGFGLTLGFTLLYLGLIVLLPLSATFLKASSLGLAEFWEVATSPRALASYRVTFGLSLLAAVSWVAAQSGALFASPLLYAMAVVQIWLVGRKVGRFNVIDAVLYPLGLVVFFAVLVRSTMVRAGLARVTWAGRRVR